MSDVSLRMTNRGLELPHDDVAAATTIVWNRLQHMLAERRQIAARARDIVQDAKAAGYPVATTRLAQRLDGLTNERRERWALEAAQAAAFFGFAGFSQVSQIEQDQQLAKFIEAARPLADERRDLAERMRELHEAAINAGVDFRTLKEVAASPGARKPRGERDEWFTRFDRVGTYLGLW